MRGSQIVQQTLLAAVAVQLVWHFVIEPWWKKRSGRGAEDL